MSDPFLQLKKITDELLSPSTDYFHIRQAVHSLKDLFCEATGFDLNAKENQQHISTDTGLAVSPYAAAFCITDMLRTRNFLLGIKEAIHVKLKENPDRPVIVLYAGTGPFATLLTPLTTVYNPSQLQLVLMDINPISIEHLQKVIQQLNMASYIIDVVEADALSYIIPEMHQPDILVSETMKPGLHKEPQVSIVANLLSQCNRHPFLIPELITVEACLIGNIANDSNAIITLQTLLELDAATALSIRNNPADVPAFVNGIEIQISEKPADPYKRLGLKTTITVFNHHRLHFNESSLTVRHVLMNLEEIKKFPARLLFKYKMENEPGFIVTEL